MNKKLNALLSFITVMLTLAYSGNLNLFAKPTNSIEIDFNSLSSHSKTQVQCLAQNIYYESAHEPNEGKLAVAFVTLNRTKHKAFPSSVCGVVTQKKNNKCQFSWFCEDKKRNKFLSKTIPKDTATYNSIVKIATFAYTNYEKIHDPTSGALFYHADYVSPIWRKDVIHTKTIGRHIFYSEKSNA